MDIDSLFSEEELMVRQTVRDFVDEEVIPIIEEANRKEEMPMHLIPKMAEMGLFGATIKEYDLPGLNNVAYGLIMQELERGDSGLRTYARKDGDSWVLNGAKAWITNGSIADVAVVWAKCDGTIRGFLVEKGTPGFTTAYHMGKFSLRASVTSQLFFEDCRIPAANVLPKTDGLKYPLSCLTQARYGIAWGALGAAMGVFHTATEYAKSRIQFGGQPIASHQLVQNKLAWMITEITKGQLLALQTGRLKDQGKLKPQHVSMAKMNNVNIALECARMARDILGANGVSDEYPIIRHMMNLESVKTYEGTHDIHNLIIGEAVTGIPAYNPPMSAQAEREATARREAEATK